ncbi:unnamed protein product [Camellia sinensis]
MELPHWTDIVKTGRFKELAPYDPDWYYIRADFMATSMSRKIYLRQGLGVGAFQRIYGGSKRNGSCPPHFCKSSGVVARHILQQLQSMNIIDIDVKVGEESHLVANEILTKLLVGLWLPLDQMNQCSYHPSLTNERSEVLILAKVGVALTAVL